MKRREFIKKTALSVPVTIGGMNIAAAEGKDWDWLRLVSENNNNVLVLIQLNGGNDGLNTIVPVDQYSNLFKARENILIPESNLLTLDGLDTIKFHPSMVEMQKLFNEEKMEIIQNVGYPNPNKSHFRSTDIWNSGSDSDVIDNTGWMGRYMEYQHPSFPEGYPNEATPDPLAITVDSLVSSTCQGSSSNMSFAVKNLNSFSELDESSASTTIPNNHYGNELKFVIESVKQANLYGKIIDSAAQKGNNLSEKYPENSKLADQLRIVANLISGGLQTKVYVVKLGGFDTHDTQVDEGNLIAGRHGALLTELSEGIAAFNDDLQLLGLNERVVSMTFSEFGRRIASNYSLGTDHGEAAPMMLFGDKVRPVVQGDNPVIPDSVGVKDNVPMQIDFRSIYGSILMDWFDIDESVAREVVHPDFEYIPLIRKPDEFTESLGFNKSFGLKQNYPNPAHDYTMIDFKSRGGFVTLELFDNAGKKVMTPIQKTLTRGVHTIKVDLSSLDAGVYHYVLKEGSMKKSMQFIKR
ncbi:MAG: DUF1501 domain-containing protein [Cyclobacteriaceae bacterium]